MPYNPNIHHRQSIRLKGYDYSQAGLYFITICVKDKECLFGEIVRAENFLPLQMILNDAGKIADACWLEIPQHFPNAILHEHIVMPNHVHGIIELTKNNTTNVVIGNVNEPPRNEFQKMIPRSIGSIVKGFKIGVTKWFHNNTDIQTVWQSRFHDHIIRNEQEYQKIANYIINNPSKWEEDKFYKQ